MKKIGKKERQHTNPKRFVTPVEAPEIFKPQEVEMPKPDEVSVEVGRPDTTGAETWPSTGR